MDCLLRKVLKINTLRITFTQISRSYMMKLTRIETKLAMQHANLMAADAHPSCHMRIWKHAYAHAIRTIIAQRRQQASRSNLFASF